MKNMRQFSNLIGSFMLLHAGSTLRYSADLNGGNAGSGLRKSIRAPDQNLFKDAVSYHPEFKEINNSS